MRELPKLEVTYGEERNICDVKAKSEEDFKRFVKSSIYVKPKKVRAIVMDVDNTIWFVAKVPELGIRVGVEVHDNPWFLEEMKEFFTVLGINHG